MLEPRGDFSLGEDGARRFLSLFLSLHPFFIKPREKTFCGNVVARDAGGLYSFFSFFFVPLFSPFSPSFPFLYHIIYDINFAPVKAAPAGVVKRAEAFLSLPAISLSLEQGTAAAEREGKKRGSTRNSGVNSGPLPSTLLQGREGRKARTVGVPRLKRGTSATTSLLLAWFPSRIVRWEKKKRKKNKWRRVSLVSEDRRGVVCERSRDEPRKFLPSAAASLWAPPPGGLLRNSFRGNYRQLSRVVLFITLCNNFPSSFHFEKRKKK